LSLPLYIAIEREFRRLAVDAIAMGGFAAPPEIEPEDLLAWLRGLPTGLGPERLLQALSTDGPRHRELGAAMPPRDPSFASPDLDEREALMTELSRLLPPERYPGWALNGTFDRPKAIRALRALPDDADWDAIAAVVPIGRVTRLA